MQEFSTTVKMNTLISCSTSDYIILQLVCLMYWFATQWDLICWKYKIHKFNLGTTTKSTNFWICELVIFNQTTKIDIHEEKYFHYTWSKDFILLMGYFFFFASIAEIMSVLFWRCINTFFILLQKKLQSYYVMTVIVVILL
jgi:hypothetical protein